ncbi:copper-transporting ATPase PAA1, chloroplastic-like isoform X1 [Cucurbita maxima]|uniref:Copper-transporting ATPase PAA1, chloroplastic-like isoform X1 n=1 Tax=Cucurbita maxima TaxID=3661 RepID=A0A6J1HX97_CUCMA|nr:copper-transporting ATPase PAA1, chloroplastic-like isoform X1 [Cucurbita maxima]
MDSALSVMASNAPLFALSTITRSFSTLNFTHSPSISPISTLSFSLRAAVPPLHRRHKFISNSSSGNGNGGVRGESGGGGGGDDGGPDGGDVGSNLLSGEAEDDATLSADAIVLGVGGMTCKGCSASVKRILESQPQVSYASVDLASETAVVWPAAEAKITPNWREELGEALAKHLTTCGFSSKVQGQGAIGGGVSL